MRRAIPTEQQELLKRISLFDENDRAAQVASLLVDGTVGLDMASAIALGCRDEDETISDGAWNLYGALSEIDLDLSDEELEELQVHTEAINHVIVELINSVDSYPERFARLGLMAEEKRDAEAWEIVTDIAYEYDLEQEIIKSALQFDDEEIVAGAQIMVDYAKRRVDGFVAKDDDQRRYLETINLIANTHV